MRILSLQEIKVLIYKKIFNNFLLIFDAIKKSNLEQMNKIKNEDFIVFLKIKNKIAFIVSIIYLIILVINMFVLKIPKCYNERKRRE